MGAILTVIEGVAVAGTKRSTLLRQGRRSILRDPFGRLAGLAA